MGIRKCLNLLILLTIIFAGYTKVMPTHTNAATPSGTTVYGDSLTNNWQDWSWDLTSRSEETSDAPVGTKVLSISTQRPYAGVYFHTNQPLLLQPNTNIVFHIKTNDLTNMKVIAYNGSLQPHASVLLKTFSAISSTLDWRQFSLPVSSLQAENSLLSGLVFQDVSGKANVSFQLDHITFTASPETQTVTSPLPTGSIFELEHARIAADAGRPYAHTEATAGNALLVWKNASATLDMQVPNTSKIAIKAKSDMCQGGAAFDVEVDGLKIMSETAGENWTEYVSNGVATAGQHAIRISFTNDLYATCDRNLRLDLVRFIPAQTAPSPVNTPPQTTTPSVPASSASMFVDPQSAARTYLNNLPRDLEGQRYLFAYLAAQPTARWFGSWNADIASDVDRYVSSAQAAGSLPVLITYNIPGRDCGGYSAGGSNSPQEYSQWIQRIATAINRRPAMIILEPDALALDTCLSSSDKQTRYQLLENAVQTLKSQSARVYIDAGHSRWISVNDMASRLTLAGISQADGFSLNISNFNDTTSETTYGRALSLQSGNKQFVIDTSRNGLGSNSEWCNPTGRALGQRPSLSTGDPQIAGYIWGKVPGESDGTCNGGPSAGQWWPEYALGLAQRSPFLP
jgi:endoglucanase